MDLEEREVEPGPDDDNDNNLEDIDDEEVIYLEDFDDSEDEAEESDDEILWFEHFYVRWRWLDLLNKMFWWCFCMCSFSQLLELQFYYKQDTLSNS